MNVDPKYSNQLSRRKNQTGVTLIEILVTVVISSIGLMGLAALQLKAREATNDSGNRSQAIWLFNDIVSRIHANEGASFSYVTNGPYACREIPTPCATYNTGIGTVVSENCSGTQMADWDMFEVACGSPKANGYFGNSVTYLPNARLDITCANKQAVCDDGAALNIELKWQARLDTESVTGRARTAESGELVISDIITP
ncbi:MAG: type IV pilus modification protein PilV [Oleispira sp.]|nr:type IV pilus modification protein PilV [Oleispira sp.]